MAWGREYQRLVVFCMAAFTYKTAGILSAFYHNSGSKHTFHLKHQDILGEMIEGWAVWVIASLPEHSICAGRASESLGIDRRGPAISSCPWGPWLPAHCWETLQLSGGINLHFTVLGLILRLYDAVFFRVGVFPLWYHGREEVITCGKRLGFNS